MDSPAKLQVVLSIIKVSIYIFCLSLLTFSIIDLFYKKQEGKTSISVEFVAHEDLRLPALTFCSAIPFKVTLMKRNIY